MFKLFFLAVLFTVTLSTSFDCTYQALTLTLEEEIFEIDITSCLKRQVCKPKYSCEKTFLPTDPGYNFYLANCKDPNFFNKHFAALLQTIRDLKVILKELEDLKIFESKQFDIDLTSETRKSLHNITNHKKVY